MGCFFIMFAIFIYVMVEFTRLKSKLQKRLNESDKENEMKNIHSKYKLAMYMTIPMYIVGIGVDVFAFQIIQSMDQILVVSYVSSLILATVGGILANMYSAKAIDVMMAFTIIRFIIHVVVVSLAIYKNYY